MIALSQRKATERNGRSRKWENEMKREQLFIAFNALRVSQGGHRIYKYQRFFLHLYFMYCHQTIHKQLDNNLQRSELRYYELCTTSKLSFFFPRASYRTDISLMPEAVSIL